HGAIELALVVGRQAGVFARQNTASIGHELAQQGGVLEIQGIYREIDLRFRTRSPDFHLIAAAWAAFVFFLMGFSWHGSLLDFAVQGMAAEIAIVLHQFNLLGLRFLVAGG